MSTVEAWAKEFVLSSDLGVKLAPPPPPKCGSAAPAACRLAGPGRPRELTVASRAPKSPAPGALAIARATRGAHAHVSASRAPGRGAHGVGAARISRGAPRVPSRSSRCARRRSAAHGALSGVLGFARLLLRELSGARLVLGARPAAAPPPAHFAALMGIGFEGGNLDHTRRFAERLRAAGDERGAELEERIGEEEIPHVRFALSWFRHFAGGDTFAVWTSHLVAAAHAHRDAWRADQPRKQAGSGMSEQFIDALEAWSG